MQTLVRSYLSGKEGKTEMAIMRRKGKYWVEQDTKNGREPLTQETESVEQINGYFISLLNARMLNGSVEEKRVDLRAVIGAEVIPLPEM